MNINSGPSSPSKQGGIGPIIKLGEHFNQNNNKDEQNKEFMNLILKKELSGNSPEGVKPDSEDQTTKN